MQALLLLGVQAGQAAAEHPERGVQVLLGHRLADEHHGPHRQRFHDALLSLQQSVDELQARVATSHTSQEEYHKLLEAREKQLACDDGSRDRTCDIGYLPERRVRGVARLGNGGAGGAVGLTGPDGALLSGMRQLEHRDGEVLRELRRAARLSVPKRKA